ncbi:hypothetical protein EJ419_03110 [Alloscardovia theropitheci]|uniref:Uncharacterized protein n=1 Tax=Alloscardovia theropitheci TaxID=2496842 RepID=A0A4V2MU03_9BIFI|nr:hypothetical protein [Alloscardovia theropitheci]TCD54479.1 hypothetical protein EJ419_03110 [Alloscardovia theropitheci]
MVPNSPTKLVIDRTVLRTTGHQTVQEFESTPFDFVSRCGNSLYGLVSSYSDNRNYFFQKIGTNDKLTTRFIHSLNVESHNDILIDAYSQSLNCSNDIITFITRESIRSDTDEEDGIKTVTTKLWKWDTQHDSLSGVSIMNGDGTSLSDGEGFILYDENSIDSNSIVFVNSYSGILSRVDMSSGKS